MVTAGPRRLVVRPADVRGLVGAAEGRTVQVTDPIGRARRVRSRRVAEKESWSPLTSAGWGGLPVGRTTIGPVRCGDSAWYDGWAASWAGSGPEDRVDPVEDRRHRAEVGGQRNRLAEPVLRASGTSRCSRAGSGRSTASGRRRRRATLAGTSTSRQSSASASAPPAIRTASSIWIGSVSWNSSSSSRSIPLLQRRPHRRRLAAADRARAPAGRGTPAGPRPGAARADSSTRSAIQCDKVPQASHRAAARPATRRPRPPRCSRRGPRLMSGQFSLRPIRPTFRLAQRLQDRQLRLLVGRRARASPRARGSAAPSAAAGRSAIHARLRQRRRSARPPRPVRSRSGIDTSSGGSDQHPLVDQVPVVPEQPRQRPQMLQLDPDRDARAAAARRSRRRPAAAAAARPSAPRRRPTTPTSSSTSISGGSPASIGCASRICCANECSVPIAARVEVVQRLRPPASRGRSPFRAFSNSARSRSRSSAPAFSVKVTAAIVRSGTPSRRTSVVTRSTSACVLPGAGAGLDEQRRRWCPTGSARAPRRRAVARVIAGLLGQRPDRSAGPARASVGSCRLRSHRARTSPWPRPSGLQ